MQGYYGWFQHIMVAVTATRNCLVVTQFQADEQDA